MSSDEERAAARARMKALYDRDVEAAREKARARSAKYRQNPSNREKAYAITREWKRVQREAARKEGVTSVAFVEAKMTPKGGKATWFEVAVAIYIPGTNPNGNHREMGLDISICGDVMTRLQWSIGDRVTIAEGTGADEGYVQLRKVENGGAGYRLSKRSKVEGNNYAFLRPSLSILTHYVARYPGQVVSMKNVTYQTFGGSLTIDVSDHLVPKDEG